MIQTSGSREGRASVPPASAAADEPSAPAVRRARRIAAIVFLAVVVAFVGISTSQIVMQAFAPEVKRGPWTTCADGLAALSGALDRGMTAAEAETDPEKGVGAFRVAVAPDWQYAEGVRESCGRPDERRGLDALERLRYAEEQSVRREAASLAPIRKQADQAIEGLSRAR